MPSTPKRVGAMPLYPHPTPLLEHASLTLTLTGLNIVNNLSELQKKTENLHYIYIRTENKVTFPQPHSFGTLISESKQLNSMAASVVWEGHVNIRDIKKLNLFQFLRLYVPVLRMNKMNSVKYQGYCYLNMKHRVSVTKTHEERYTN